MPAEFPPFSPIVLAVGTTNKAKLEAVYEAIKTCYPRNKIILFSFSVSSGVSDQPMSAEETITGAVNRAIAALDTARELAKSDKLRFADSINKKIKFPQTSPLREEKSCTAAVESKRNESQIAVHEAEEADDTIYNTIHFGVGLEGGIETVGRQFFECGWMAIAENPENAYLSIHQTAKPRDNASLWKYNVGIGSSARFEMSEVLMKKITEEKKELATVMDELTGETDLRSTMGAMGVLTAGHLGRAAAYKHGILFAMAKFLSSEKFWSA